MTVNNSKSNILAHWHYENDLWRDFIEYESTVYKDSVRVAKHIFIAILIITISLVFLLLFVPFWFIGKMRPDIWQPAVAVGFLGLISLFVTGIIWLYRREQFNRLQTKNGEAIISLNGVNRNGMSFDWGYGEPGVRFNKVERKIVSVSSGKNFEILEFHTLNYFSNYDGRNREYWELRVPIPFGKEAEAERIISSIRSTLALAEQEWIKENSALGHSFSQGVCRMCGETVAEAAGFDKHNCQG